MSKKKPVVIYGASGFSGRLVAEFLREYNVPFIAAGRNRAKLEEVMSRVPGIETADYEIAAVGESVDDLAKLFAGAKVVCNTVGPFIYNGPRVIEASLQADCHYMDIGGEQAWIREVDEKWGEKFAARRLLAAPATAFMSAVSDAAARLLLETGAIDTLETVTMFKGIPTFGSTQTIFAVIQTDAYYLEQNRYKPWPRATRYDVAIPGYIQNQLALAWGGFPHPVWFKNHHRWRMSGRLADCSIARSWRTLQPRKRCSKNKSVPCPRLNKRRNWRTWRIPCKAPRRLVKTHMSSAPSMSWPGAGPWTTDSALSSAPALTVRLD